MQNINGEREGVIKYHLSHQHTDLADDLNISELNAWRTLLYRLHLIGQIPEKYDGLGFGNISCRVVPDGEGFLISGTQTGGLSCLGKQHFALVETATPQKNAIQSRGLCPPSSEALTHAGVYLLEPAIQAVIHVHSPELWRNTQRLQLPHTSSHVPYGTPEMAQAVTDLFNSGQLEAKRIFTMLGHEDGVVAFGASLAEAAELLIAELVKAIALEQQLLA